MLHMSMSETHNEVKFMISDQIKISDQKKIIKILSAWIYISLFPTLLPLRFNGCNPLFQVHFYIKRFSVFYFVSLIFFFFSLYLSAWFIDCLAETSCCFRAMWPALFYLVIHPCYHYIIMMTMHMLRYLTYTLMSWCTMRHHTPPQLCVCFLWYF